MVAMATRPMDPACIGVTIDDNRKARWYVAGGVFKPAGIALAAECSGVV